MSTCRDCGARITWARSADGAKWLRPFEARYTALAPDDDETVVTLVAGEWRETNVSQFRMYKRHNCPVDDGEYVGPSKVRVYEDDDEELEERRRRLDEEAAAQDEEYRLEQLARAVRKYKDHQLRVDCPECYATPGEPCKVPGTDNLYINQAHTPRNLMTAFEDDQPWPPRINQRGYKAMRQWLSENANIFEERGLQI